MKNLQSMAGDTQGYFLAPYPRTTKFLAIISTEKSKKNNSTDILLLLIQVKRMLLLMYGNCSSHRMESLTKQQLARSL